MHWLYHCLEFRLYSISIAHFLTVFSFCPPPLHWKDLLCNGGFTKDALASSWSTSFYSHKVSSKSIWITKKIHILEISRNPCGLPLTESHQHYHFLVIKHVLTEFVWLPSGPQAANSSEKAMAPWFCHDTEETPACAKGQVLYWKCCRLLSSLLELAGVLIAAFPTISVFQAFLSQWIQCISKYYIMKFQSRIL